MNVLVLTPWNCTLNVVNIKMVTISLSVLYHNKAKQNKQTKNQEQLPGFDLGLLHVKMERKI